MAENSLVQQGPEQIRREEDATRSDREWLLYADKVFQSKIPSLWKQLFALAEGEVNEWNDGLGRRNHSLHIEFQPTVPSGFLARRRIFPAVYVKAELDKEDHSIRFTVERKTDRETQGILVSGKIHLELCEADRELHFYDGERTLPESGDVVSIILKPLFSR